MPGGQALGREEVHADRRLVERADGGVARLRGRGGRAPRVTAADRGHDPAAERVCECVPSSSLPLLNRVLDVYPRAAFGNSKFPDSTLTFLEDAIPEHLRHLRSIARPSSLRAPFAHARDSCWPPSAGASSTPWPRPWPSTATPRPRWPRWWRGRACRARPSTSTSPTRRSASSRCTTPGSLTCSGACWRRSRARTIRASAWGSGFAPSSGCSPRSPPSAARWWSRHRPPGTVARGAPPGGARIFADRYLELNRQARDADPRAAVLSEEWPWALVGAILELVSVRVEEGRTDALPELADELDRVRGAERRRARLGAAPRGSGVRVSGGRTREERADRRRAEPGRPSADPRMRPMTDFGPTIRDAYAADGPTRGPRARRARRRGGTRGRGAGPAEDDEPPRPGGRRHGHRQDRHAPDDRRAAVGRRSGRVRRRREGRRLRASACPVRPAVRRRSA